MDISSASINAVKGGVMKNWKEFGFKGWKWMSISGLVFFMSACSSLSLTADMPEEHESSDEMAVSEPFSNQLIERYSPGARGNVERGKVLFTSLCSGCHSDEEDRSMTKYLDGFSSDGAQPPNFTRKQYDSTGSKDYLFLKVKYGGKKRVLAHSMPAWGEVLEDSDINDLVSYVMSIAQ